MTTSIKQNMDTVFHHLDSMNLYNDDEGNLNQTKRIHNLHTLGYFIIHIQTILQNTNLSIQEKKKSLKKITKDGKPFLTKDTIDLILENQENYLHMFQLFSLFRQNTKQQTGGSNSIFQKIPEEFLFPFNAIENNIPIAELLFDWSLFLSTMISVFSKLATPFIKFIMKFGTDLFWTMLGAIPLFGLDPIVAAVSIPMKYGLNLFIEFIISLIQAMPHLYKFIIQLGRKNIDDAIKEFSQTTLLFSQLYTLINNALPLLNNNLMFLTEYMPTLIKFAEPFAGMYLTSLHILNNFFINFIPEPSNVV